MDDDLEAVRAIFASDEPIVIQMRHEPHEEAQRLLVGLGAGYIVDPAAARCVRQCGREECRVSAVATRRWCRMYGCGDEPVEGSEFCSAHQHAAGEPNGRNLLERMDAGEPVGLEEAAAVGKRAESGAALLLVGEPERAAASSSPKPGPVEPAPTPEGEPARAGGGARAKWMREFTHHSRGRRTPEASEALWEQACRQRWRALLLVIKAKLEAIEVGVATFEDEFLAYTMLPSGETVGSWLAPQMEVAYDPDRGVMPGGLRLALTSGDTGEEE